MLTHPYNTKFVSDANTQRWTANEDGEERKNRKTKEKKKRKMKRKITYICHRQ
jgi:hypothetical protein